MNTTKKDKNQCSQTILRNTRKVYQNNVIKNEVKGHK